MGRNAKLYKAHKSKKKQSTTQDQVSTPLAGLDLFKTKRQIREAKVTAARGERQGQGVESGQGKAVEAGIVDTQGNKLKSKLWRDLEAKRAKEGKGEYSTPKEAGIDYLRQWEKRGR
jgi:hypothetical protein